MNQVEAMDETVLFVGDLHCKQELVLPYVSKAIEEFAVSKVVFLGDYVDDWHVCDAEAVIALDFHVKWYKSWSKKVEVVNLCGNHDFCYLFKDPTVASGHMYSIEKSVAYRLGKLDLKASCCVGNRYICTHAGVTKEWAKLANISKESSPSDVSYQLNRIISSSEARLLNMCGSSRGGEGIPGPLWSDVSDMENDAFEADQIVGHSPVSQVSCTASVSQSKTYFCDTMSVLPSGRAVGDASMMLLNVNRDAVEFLKVPDWEIVADKYHNRLLEVRMAQLLNN